MVILPYTREDLWKNLPENMVVAELGVWVANYSDSILKGNPKKLYLVDFWEEVGQGKHMGGGKAEDEYNNVCKKYANNPIVDVRKKDSKQFLREVDFLDVSYIDSTHEYENTKDELELSYQKCRMFITGHDYNPQFGVVQAVDEFVSKWGLEFSLTAEKDYPSFVIDIRGVIRNGIQ